ncbi:MAG: hypothetical protein COB67_08245 [SAR324 cluster bacterium]|uniref:Uncharacterized protein n=1 Tax=SAR324 cluster bacterium TaxID=2024889 RepID=A0A2A4T236_9DELT|nr:MAG: hypothetical protein COB67_08245 [SAR324 cluster bacterium]
MSKPGKRGPRKGKRVTPEVQTTLVMEALLQDKSLDTLINDYKEDGYNFSDGIEEDLRTIDPSEISFMLANRQLLRSIREDAINTFISDIKTK